MSEDAPPLTRYHVPIRSLAIHATPLDVSLGRLLLVTPTMSKYTNSSKSMRATMRCAFLIIYET